MTNGGFVPHGYEPPLVFFGKGWRLEPLGTQHNVADHAAWTASMEHIRATPGFGGRPWPHPMTLDQNRGDLVMHEEGFAAREEFAYTVLDHAGRVVGCVYVMPDEADERPDAAYMRCWVRADRADLDAPLREAVTAWLRADWPFAAIRVDAEST